MPAFEFTAQTPRPFACVRLKWRGRCGAHGVRGPECSVRESQHDAVRRAGGAFSVAADGAVTLRLGFPAVSEAAAALSAAGLLIGETFGARTLRGVYSGDYGSLRDAYDATRAEMAALGVTSTDNSWERYIGGSAANPQQPWIEVLMPVRAG